MKALSLWQPWASGMARGLKLNETRSWSPPKGLIGQPLAIHAAARRPLGYERVQWAPLLADLDVPYWESLPYGAVVCVVRVLDWQRTEDVRNQLTARERSWGDYTSCRFAWITELLEVMETPIPARGAQGLWEWTPGGGVVTPNPVRPQLTLLEVVR